MKLKLKWLKDTKVLAKLILVPFAVIAIASGLYILSPLYPEVASEVPGQPLASSAARGEQLFFAWLYLGVPLVSLAGLIFNKIRMVKTGAFLLFVLYVFIAALRIITIGWLPITWLFMLGIAVVVGICWLVLKK